MDGERRGRYLLNPPHANSDNVKRLLGPYDFRSVLQRVPPLQPDGSEEESAPRSQCHDYTAGDVKEDNDTKR
jgi:hypothetical protein